MFNRLENFLEQFPTNATSWSQATDEGTTWHTPHVSSFMSMTMSKSRQWISQHSTLPLNGTAYTVRLFGVTTT